MERKHDISGCPDFMVWKPVSKIGSVTSLIIINSVETSTTIIIINKIFSLFILILSWEDSRILCPFLIYIKINEKLNLIKYLCTQCSIFDIWFKSGTGYPLPTILQKMGT